MRLFTLLTFYIVTILNVTTLFLYVVTFKDYGYLVIMSSLLLLNAYLYSEVYNLHHRQEQFKRWKVYITTMLSILLFIDKLSEFIHFSLLCAIIAGLCLLFVGLYRFGHSKQQTKRG